MVCNSAEQELVIADASSGAVTGRVELQGWTRGLAVDGDVIYALDIRDSLKDLQRLMPDRTLYVYERAPRSSTGALRRLDDPAAPIAVY